MTKLDRTTTDTSKSTVIQEPELKDSNGNYDPYLIAKAAISYLIPYTNEKVRDYSEDIATVAQYMMLEALKGKYGLDWENDPNFTETPRRVAKSVVNDMCKGINSEKKIKSILSKTFPTSHKDLVASGPIEFYGLCPHHFFPVRYKCFFGYIPKGTAIGLSKIPRTIKLYGSQPILQEDLTNNYIKIFENTIDNYGCIFLVKGQHGCMTCRGAEVGHDYWVTSISKTGSFSNTNGVALNEFFTLIGENI